MRGKSLGIGLVAVLVLVFAWQVVLAAPLPPRTAVNHETRECAEYFAGDECMDCFPPEGWEVLDYDAECPAGYAVVGEIDYTCQPFKSQFCCSEGHSGAHGDCEDLVLNDRDEECAFVQDIHNCELPRGWSQKPDDRAVRDWFCPSGYAWIESLPCVDQEGGQGGGETGAESNRLPCLGTALAGPVVVAAWLLLKRTR